eukprot:g2849.t1
MRGTRQNTLKQSGLFASSNPVNQTEDSNVIQPSGPANKGTEKRKRASRVMKSYVSDNERAKRKTKQTGKKTTKPKKKPRNEEFEFQPQDATVAETPRMPKVSTTTEVEDSIPSSDNDVEMSDTSSDSGSPGSVSIRQKAIKGRDKTSSRTSGDVKEAQYQEFDPKKAYEGKHGESIPYHLLSSTFQSIEGTTKRHGIIRLLTESFRIILEFNVGEILPAVYLCINELGPPHEGLKLGVGNDIVVRAISSASGSTNLERLKEEFHREGDLGTLAMKKKAKTRLIMEFDSLTISRVHSQFLAIAKYTGDKPMEAKRTMIESLLHASKGAETKFIVRSLLGKLRIGLADQTVLQALGQAFFLHQEGKKRRRSFLQSMEESVEKLKLVYSQCPSFDKVIDALVQYGIDELENHVSFTPGIPVHPMLAKPTKGVQEVLEKFTETPFTCEFKYDGERCQVHVLSDGRIFVYSRNFENLTPKYPDIVKRMPQFLKEGVESVVLDCESVAYDQQNQKILPFQALSTRARKDIKVEDIKVNICLFCFDCLYLNGTALLSKPLVERREALYSCLNTETGILEFAEQQTSVDVEELQNFLDQAVTKNTEGLVVKTLDCTYEPSKRSVNWLKLKKDYIDSLGDSFDLVVIGGWHGKGKRTGVFGSFLLAVYDPIEDEYQTISKIGTGFSDEDLTKFHDGLDKLQIEEPYDNYQYSENLIPDKWFEAQIVWEVKAADISISPIHKAAFGMIDREKGISIRFPRLIRVREDKGPRDATTAEQVAEMYKAQSTILNDAEGTT